MDKNINSFEEQILWERVSTENITTTIESKKSNERSSGILRELFSWIEKNAPLYDLDEKSELERTLFNMDRRDETFLMIFE